VKTLSRILLALALAAGVILALNYREHLDAAALTAWVASAGAAGPLVFMGVYAIATVLFLPGSVLTLAGGALFGPVLGTFYNLTGATLGATLAFLVARYLASNWITQRAGGRVKQLIEGVEAEGWRFVAFVRLVPLFPFNLLNYALGLTRIKLSHYIITSYICMLPGALAYTYLGYAGREALGGGGSLIQKGLLALGLLALVAFLPRLIGTLRKGPMINVDELKHNLDAGKEILVLDVRGAKEFSGELSHIHGARNLPVEELPQRISELESARDTPIAIVCHTDKRSAKAAQQLVRAGFSRVVVLRGGMTQWHKQGFPVD
jgi:uncharacterized membrane protein YdjX (TVP38/TMEM64 family)/rhodanese-related sulfurtransferase